MLPLCMELKDITQDQIKVFYELRHILIGITATDCHTVCAELSKKFPELQHYTGKFYDGWDHSWLVFRNDPDVIIDAYPWACAVPFIVTTQAMSPWRFLYRGIPRDIWELKNG